MIPRYNTSPNFESSIRHPLHDIEQGLMHHWPHESLLGVELSVSSVYNTVFIQQIILKRSVFLLKRSLLNIGSQHYESLQTHLYHE